MIETKLQEEIGIMIAVPSKREPNAKVEEYLNELSFLSKTMGVHIVHSFVQKLERPDNRTFVGRGKLEEIVAYVKHEKVDVAVFDDDLSPSQLRNLEKELKIKIYDRSLLILDIFLKRAKTSQAKTQVELARFQYLLPRLTRMWTHLERQRGGTNTRGGAGEKEIETDRRIIRDRISLLRKQLDKVEKQSLTRRKSRQGVVRITLVGYTNAGKSTLMKLLSKEKVYARDELFATVDSTVRKVVINQTPFLLSDTVGFIRKLPHNLIESFKSTLAEVQEADVLLHVIDLSNPAYRDHMAVVEETLSQIGASNIPAIQVFNKVDKVPDTEIPRNGSAKQSLFVSAKTKMNLELLQDQIYRMVLKQYAKNYPDYHPQNAYG